MLNRDGFRAVAMCEHNDRQAYLANGILSMSDSKTRLADVLRQKADIEVSERIHQTRTDWLASVDTDEEPTAYRKFREALNEAP
jgi:hypothetical protein